MTVAVEKDEIVLRIENALGVEFSEPQLNLIVHQGSPLNGLSCAGSGKTTANIGKCAYMELSQGVNPDKIIAISFNREAANEMRSRHLKMSQRLGIQSRVTFSTYHAFYLRILKDYFPRMEVDDGSKTNRMFYMLARKYMGYDANEEIIENMKNLRGYAINNLITSSAVLFNTPKFATSKVPAEVYQKVMRDYKEAKDQAGLLDFDDLQYRMYKLMSENDQAREKIQDMYSHWIIDEYQDVSKIQLEILKLTISDYNNLTTIGDDDQAIYDFRGSKVDYIVDMPLHFKGTRRVIMPTNYRCPENILKPIEKSIKINRKRVQKEMVSSKEGGSVKFIPTSSNAASSIAIAIDIAQYFQENARLDKVAVLYRNLRQQLFLVDMLIERFVPVKVTRNFGLFYNHIIIKDLISIASCAMNPNDAALFQKTAMKFTKFVKKQEIEGVAKKMKMTGYPWHELMAMSTNDSVQKARMNMEMIANLIEADVPFARVIDAIFEVYKEYLIFLTDKTELSSAEAEEILQYAKYISRDRTFRKFLDYIQRSEAYIKMYSKESNAVTITTMHGVKGLEFSRVYLLHASEEYCPNRQIETKIRTDFGDAEAEEYIEQENRLFYVAWTRAIDELIVTYPREGTSRFLLNTGIDLPAVSEPFVDFDEHFENLEKEEAAKREAAKQSLEATKAESAVTEEEDTSYLVSADDDPYLDSDDDE